METKANYVLIGAATVIGFVLILLFGIWLGTASLRGGYNEYDVVFEDPVRGLAVGGEVRFNGIKVGEVRTLRIDPENTNWVIARIRVSADVPLRRDSEARLEPMGLTGVTLIQLSAGTAGQPPLRPRMMGPPPRLRGRGSQIDLLVARSEDIALRASEAMAAVRDLLTDENIANVSAAVADLKTVSHQLADRRSVVNSSAETARALTEASRSITALARTTEASMAQLHAAADTTANQTLPDVEQAVQEIRRAAVDIQRVAQSLDQTSQSLNARTARPTVELQP